LALEVFRGPIEIGLGQQVSTANARGRRWDENRQRNAPDKPAAREILSHVIDRGSLLKNDQVPNAERRGITASQ
jgi:hypothetical protein